MSRRTPSRLSLPVLLPGPEREISGPGQRILLRATFPSVRKPCQKGRFKVPPARKNGSFPFCGSLGEPKTLPRRNPAALFRSPPRSFAPRPGLSLFARSHPPRLFPLFSAPSENKKHPVQKAIERFSSVSVFAGLSVFFPENPLPGTFLAIFLPERLCGNSPRKKQVPFRGNRSIPVSVKQGFGVCRVRRVLLA